MRLRRLYYVRRVLRGGVLWAGATFAVVAAVTGATVMSVIAVIFPEAVFVGVLVAFFVLLAIYVVGAYRTWDAEERRASQAESDLEDTQRQLEEARNAGAPVQAGFIIEGSDNVAQGNTTNFEGPSEVSAAPTLELDELRARCETVARKIAQFAREHVPDASSWYLRKDDEDGGAAMAYYHKEGRAEIESRRQGAERQALEQYEDRFGSEVAFLAQELQRRSLSKSYNFDLHGNVARIKDVAQGLGVQALRIEVLLRSGQDDQS
jgi:type II secretory pathway pseudopilin PulG